MKRLSLIFILTLSLQAQIPLPGGGSGGGSGVGAANPKCTFSSSATSCSTWTPAITSLHADSNSRLHVQCYTGVSTTQTPLALTTYTYTTSAGIVDAVTANFSSAAANGYCAVNATGSAGSAGPPGNNGVDGAAGAIGAGYGATSLTLVNIATGSHVFTLISNSGGALAYAIGDYAAVHSAANSANYMEGVATAWDGTNLTLNVTVIGGSGSHADWNVALAGRSGTNGINGVNGANGSGFNGRGTYASMTASSPSTNDTWQLTDAAVPGGCGAGSGSYGAECQWNGSAWVSLQGYDATKNGVVYVQGTTGTSGIAFSIANAGGTPVSILLPTDSSSTTSGYTWTIGASTTCPTNLPSWAPQTCRLSTWSPSGSGGFVTAPTSPSDTCTTGQYSFSSTYAFGCSATNTWQRVGWAAWTQVADPTFDNGTATYNNDVTVTATLPTSGSTGCYTTNGTTPGAGTPGSCDSSPTSTYSTPLTISATGTTLKMLGTKSALTNSNVTSATYTLTSATPTDSPGAGSYGSTQSVTLATTTTSGYTCYTTDNSSPTGTGSSCTNGTHYTGAISVAATTTIKAVTNKTGYGTSGVLTSTYTITGGGGGATISMTQQAAAALDVSNPPSTSCSLSSTTAGQILVVWAFSGNTGNTITLTATGGTITATERVHHTSSSLMSIWTAKLPSSITAVTIHGTVFSGIWGHCRVYSSTGGAFTSDPFVAAHTGFAAASSDNTFDSGAATATVNGSWLVGGVLEDYDAASSAWTFTPAASWTTGITVGSSSYGSYLSDWLNVNANSYSFTGSESATGGNGGWRFASAILVMGPQS